MTRYKVLVLTTIIVASIMMPNTVLASIVHEVNFPKESFSIIKKDGYDKITLDQGFYTFVVGKPELPIRTINLAIPRDVIVTKVNVLSVEKTALKGKYYIYPRQKEYVIGQETQFAYPDAKTYSSKESYPGKIIEFSGHSFTDGIHVASFSFYPLQYLPSEGRLFLYTHIKFQVEITPMLTNQSKLRFKTRGGIEDPIRKIVDNPEDINLYTNAIPAIAKPITLPEDDVPYVIITNDQMKSSFQTLANWKTKKGTKTKVISISEISDYPGVDLGEQIKNFIIDAKNTWDTEWILLGGDVGIIPARYAWFGANDSILTDYYFECLDDMWDSNSNGRYAEREDDPDLLPDIYVGRAPVKTASAADVFCSKLFNYEFESPDTIKDYQTKALFLSSLMFWDNDGQDLNNELSTHMPAYFTKSFHYEYPKQDGITEMNSGYNLIVNYSHAQHPGNFLARYESTRDPIDTLDIDQLTNNNRFSVMLNVTCKNNKLDFQDADCLSKHFLSNPTGAGVGYIGSSTFDMPFTSKDIHSVFFDNIFSNGIFGKSLTDAKLLNFSSVNYYYTTERFIMLSYILLGDPQMEVWTETPLDIVQTNYPTALDTGVHTIQVCVKEDDSLNFLEWAKVCLSKDDEVYETRHTSSEMGKRSTFPNVGESICPVPARFYDIHFPTPGWAHLVSSKKNCIPVEDSILVGAPYAPDGLWLELWSCHSMVVHWVDNSSNEAGFKIKRKTKFEDWSQIATVGSNTEFFDDQTVSPPMEYHYTVVAYNAIGDTPSSDTVSAEPPDCPDPPGCPFLYVWNGEGFVNDNVILTGSEDEYNDKLSLIDHYLLSQSLTSKDGKYELEIREYENEVSMIDQARLFSVEYPLDKNIGVTPEGKVWIYSNPISPISCVDQDGVDRLAEVTTKDNEYFVSKKPGYLIVNFGKLIDAGLPKPSGQMSGGGGGGIPPPPKQPQKLAPYTGGSRTNIVYVDVIDQSGEWKTVAKVYPRTRSVLNLVELHHFVNPNEDFKIKIGWERSFSADHIAYYRFDDTQVTMSELGLFSATHSDQGDINTLLDSDDDQRVVLSPDQAIGLSFTALPEDSSKQRRFLLVAKGYYEKLEAPAPDSSGVARISTPGMDQNYPNPFNLSTEIRFTLPDDAKVTLNIYNILGQKVKTLVDEEKSSGTHTIFWDGTDKSGAEVASGIYFYQLKAGEYKKLKKMLLIK